MSYTHMPIYIRIPIYICLIDIRPIYKSAHFYPYPTSTPTYPHTHTHPPFLPYYPPPSLLTSLLIKIIK
ncbi:hypothetical protein NBO_368g0003 [Nosema bombycis CQ1]|uniref:Uncharacterized protein n=1 Tax=Nosema bombycis (strain CQ1 / CVCC 102059) TaxID=578461 RepID=R0MIZ2_NOSB1|nr:hypothetical protein NBO_368g0003 [Nosema bombycis CQ1]|eukprot:EOB12768.1 hypothetical protein NBO_368g0003 [Nosema bombycis CQ1]